MEITVISEVATLSLQVAPSPILTEPGTDSPREHKPCTVIPLQTNEVLREGGNCARTHPRSPGPISRELMPEALGSLMPEALGSGQAHPGAAPEGVWEQPGEGQQGKTSWEAMKCSCIKRDPHLGALGPDSSHCYGSWAGKPGSARAGFLPRLVADLSTPTPALRALHLLWRCRCCPAGAAIPFALRSHHK